MSAHPEPDRIKFQLAALFDAMQTGSLSRDPPLSDSTISDLCDIGLFLITKLCEHEDEKSNGASAG